jgi:hypothetical protein
MPAGNEVEDAAEVGANPTEQHDSGLLTVPLKPLGVDEPHLEGETERDTRDVLGFIADLPVLDIFLNIGEVEIVPRLGERGGPPDHLRPARRGIPSGQRDTVRALVGLHVAKQRRQNG